jgi:5-methylcytosine-specific restriction protein B
MASNEFKQFKDRLDKGDCSVLGKGQNYLQSLYEPEAQEWLEYARKNDPNDDVRELLIAHHSNPTHPDHGKKWTNHLINSHGEKSKYPNVGTDTYIEGLSVDNPFYKKLTKKEEKIGLIVAINLVVKHFPKIDLYNTVLGGSPVSLTFGKKEFNSNRGEPILAIRPKRGKNEAHIGFRLDANNFLESIKNENVGITKDHFTKKFELEELSTDAIEFKRYLELLVKSQSIKNRASGKRRRPNNYLAEESAEKVEMSDLVEESSPLELKENSMPLNTILYGPPGTGKTYNTAQKAIEICGKHIEGAGRAVIMAEYKELYKAGRISFITFHQSYGYEEFVEGLRPVLKDDTPSDKLKVETVPVVAKSARDVQYEIRDGAFKMLCEKARVETVPYVIIIDEINRGNISKIFGELISLIEEDKREGRINKLTVTLPYSQKPFSVPSNVYIIGTMNTADRSLALVDTALRRRFHFEEMMPKPDVLDEGGELEINGIKISKMLEKINQRIEALYDREHTIGHAYFTELKGDEKNNKFILLQSIFKNKIIPLLEEYFFEDWEKIRKVLGDNQKKQSEYQFVISESLDLKVLFGEKQDDDFHQADEKKTYAFNDVGFCNPLSYIRIYQPKEL